MPNFFDQFDPPPQNSGVVQLPASPPKPPGGFVPPGMNRPVVPITGGDKDPNYIAAAAAAEAAAKAPVTEAVSAYDSSLGVNAYKQKKLIDEGTPTGRAAIAAAQAKAQKDAFAARQQQNAQVQDWQTKFNLLKQAAEADDFARTSNLSTGGLASVFSHVPGTNPYNLQTQLHNLQQGLSNMGNTTSKQLSGGTGTPGRNIYEFKSNAAAAGPLNLANGYDQLHSNLHDAQTMLRTAIAPYVGIDPSKTDIWSLPGAVFDPAARAKKRIGGPVAAPSQAAAAGDVDGILRQHGVLP